MIEYSDTSIIDKVYDPMVIVLPLESRAFLTEAFGSSQAADEAAFFSADYEDDAAQNIFDKQFYMYDTINGIAVKIIQPKKIGKGKTGVYFPRLKDGRGLSIYALNLDSAGHRDALGMFRRIKYK